MKILIQGSRHAVVEAVAFLMRNKSGNRDENSVIL
jgi:hypothetical protein